MTPVELRQKASSGQFDSPTTGYCEGYVQANLVAMPDEFADDFEQFCKLNPKPCPLLEKVGPGDWQTRVIAQNADLRKELPKYKIFIDGKFDRAVTDITEIYRADWVFFLLGCSFTFEAPLMEAGIRLRHIEQGQNVSMYQTNIPLNAAGRFSGEMVVSMRPIRWDRVVDACIITAHYPDVHGAPIHIGYPEMIGIDDLTKVDYGDPVDIMEDETPVFWACGVTPQNALLHAKIPLAVTHFPGHMFVGDIRDKMFYKDHIRYGSCPNL